MLPWLKRIYCHEKSSPFLTGYNVPRNGSHFEPIQEAVGAWFDLQPSDATTLTGPLGENPVKSVESILHTLARYEFIDLNLEMYSEHGAWYREWLEEWLKSLAAKGSQVRIRHLHLAVNIIFSDDKATDLLHVQHLCQYLESDSCKSSLESFEFQTTWNCKKGCHEGALEEYQENVAQLFMHIQQLPRLHTFSFPCNVAFWAGPMVHASLHRPSGKKQQTKTQHSELETFKFHGNNFDVFLSICQAIVAQRRDAQADCEKYGPGTLDLLSRFDLHREIGSRYHELQIPQSVHTLLISSTTVATLSHLLELVTRPSCHVHTMDFGTSIDQEDFLNDVSCNQILEYVARPHHRLTHVTYWYRNCEFTRKLQTILAKHANDIKLDVFLLNDADRLYIRAQFIRASMPVQDILGLLCQPEYIQALEIKHLRCAATSSHAVPNLMIHQLANTLARCTRLERFDALDVICASQKNTGLCLPMAVLSLRDLQTYSLTQIHYAGRWITRRQRHVDKRVDQHLHRNRRRRSTWLQTCMAIAFARANYGSPFVSSILTLLPVCSSTLDADLWLDCNSAPSLRSFTDRFWTSHFFQSHINVYRGSHVSNTTTLPLSSCKDRKRKRADELTVSPTMNKILPPVDENWAKGFVKNEQFSNIRDARVEITRLADIMPKEAIPDAPNLVIPTCPPAAPPPEVEENGS